MSNEDDIKEFISEALKFKGDNEDSFRITLGDQPSLNDMSDKINKLLTGQPVQYTRYGGGYAPTSSTINSLPAGCYDVHSDQKCIFVVPTLAPSGILLELPEMRSDDVLKIVETFWNSEKDYKEGNEFVNGGATYKLGIMLFGPPGSGKTKCLQLVSNKLIERGGTVFYASGNPAAIAAFLSDFAKVEKNRKSIVILEDLDSLIENFGESRYLEMLDSAKTIDNVLFIATTNYPDKLDPRIYNRPGRFSHVIKVGLPTAKAREAYLKAILKDHRDVDFIVKESEGFTIDHLTSLISGVYREKKNMQDELKRLRTLFNIPKVKDDMVGIKIGGE